MSISWIDRPGIVTVSSTVAVYDGEGCVVLAIPWFKVNGISTLDYYTMALIITQENIKFPI